MCWTTSRTPTLASRRLYSNIGTPTLANIRKTCSSVPGGSSSRSSVLLLELLHSGDRGTGSCCVFGRGGGGVLVVVVREEEVCDDGTKRVLDGTKRSGTSLFVSESRSLGRRASWGLKQFVIFLVPHFRPIRRVFDVEFFFPVAQRDGTSLIYERTSSHAVNCDCEHLDRSIKQDAFSLTKTTHLDSRTHEYFIFTDG